MGLFSTKSLERIQAEAESKNELRRTLGPISLIALGVGGIIGAGIFTLTGVAAATKAGPGLVISFVLAAIGCVFAGLCYSEFATMIPIAGSAYTYAYATMGELVAWIIGWDLVLEYSVGAATVSIGWSQTLKALLQNLGINLPARLTASPFEVLPGGGTAHGILNLPAVLIVVAVSALLMIGIRESAGVNNVIVVLKVGVILTFIAIGWSFIKPANLTPLIPQNTGHFGEFGYSGLLAGAGVIFFAYIGFDAVSTAAQEAKLPKRDMPIGIIGSLLVCTVLFILYTHVLTGIVPYKSMAQSAAPISLALKEIRYGWLSTAMNMAILAGLTSVMLVMLLGQSRVFFSMANDRLLPKLFRDVHPRFRTPWRCNFVLMIFVSVFAAFVPIKVVGEMTSIGTLFAFVIVCAGIMIMRKTNPNAPRPFRTPLVPLIPILGIAVCLAMMLGLGWTNWARLVGWLAIGLIIYFGYSRSRSLLNQEK
jgi:APA family basic amino acid/polyamine antiporter